MTIPTIVLNDVTYKPKGKPKAKLWREINEFVSSMGDNIDIADGKVLDKLYKLIADAFANPEVTPQTIEDGLDIDEVMPKFIEVSQYVSSLVSAKVNQLPNG